MNQARRPKRYEHESNGQATQTSQHSTHPQGSSNSERLARMAATNTVQRVDNLDSFVTNGGIIDLNAEGPGIIKLQQIMGELGFPVQTTGVFDPTTQATLRKLQQSLSVQATGRVGPTTLQNLRAASDRGSAAVQGAYRTYLEGVKKHGADNSWETTGQNRGPLVDEIEEANYANHGFQWCGMFIGHSYEKAGIRQEILRNSVFWSGYRLHMFFTKGEYIGSRAGSWWKTHTTMQIGATTGEKRKQKLDAFAPKPGDVALFRSDYSHVGMVTSYNSDTGDLDIIEGNRGNRVQANIYDSSNGEITFIGRFNASDYGPASDMDKAVTQGPKVNVKHSRRSGHHTT